jgi:hypothetical protein
LKAAMMSLFGSGRPTQGDAQVRDLEDRLYAIRGSMDLAIKWLRTAKNVETRDEQDHIIDVLTDLLERVKQTATL